ncbi:MAG: metallophosphoesterase [Cyanobacteria bacterium J06631_2]
MKRRAYWLIIGLVFSLMVGYLIAARPPAAIDAVAADLYLPPRQDFRIVVISDLNSQYGSTEYEPEVTQAISLIPQWQPDLVLCGGDMIAGQKTSLTKSEIESMWGAFDTQVAAPLRSQQIPFGFTIGNHDGSGAVKEQDFIFPQERELAQAYWQQQDSSLNFIDRTNFPFYYTFKQNEIFFLAWDASTAEISPQQLDWIEETLQSSEAQQAKVRIVLGHLPLYPVAQTKNKPGEYLTEGDKLRSLLVDNQVLGYVSGHHHVYYPGRVNNLELLHAGALGQGARRIIDSESLPKKTLTVMDLNLTKTDLTYTTYDATTWQPISLEQLPAFIPFAHGKIWRHDQKSFSFQR